MNKLTVIDLVHISLNVELPGILHWPHFIPLTQIIQKQYPDFSKSHIKRLIQQGAIKVNNIKIDDESLILLEHETIVQVGKRNYFKLTI